MLSTRLVEVFQVRTLCEARVSRSLSLSTDLELSDGSVAIAVIAVYGVLHQYHDWYVASFHGAAHALDCGSVLRELDPRTGSILHWCFLHPEPGLGPEAAFIQYIHLRSQYDSLEDDNTNQEDYVDYERLAGKSRRRRIVEPRTCKKWSGMSSSGREALPMSSRVRVTCLFRKNEEEQ